jgi:hypothetical protein
MFTRASNQRMANYPRHAVTDNADKSGQDSLQVAQDIMKIMRGLFKAQRIIPHYVHHSTFLR